MLCWNPSRSLGFGVWATHLLVWPCNKPFFAPNLGVSVCLACVLGTHMHLVTYLSHDRSILLYVTRITAFGEKSSQSSVFPQLLIFVQSQQSHSTAFSHRGLERHLCLFKVLLITLMTFTQHLLSKSHSSTCSKDTETHRPWHGFPSTKMNVLWSLFYKVALDAWHVLPVLAAKKSLIHLPTPVILSFPSCLLVCLLHRVRLFVTPWTVAH